MSANRGQFTGTGSRGGGRAGLEHCLRTGVDSWSIRGIALGSESGVNYLREQGGACWRELALVVEEPLFVRQAAGVAGQGAVAADDAVAGDDDGDRVGSVGGADRATGGGAADAVGELA